MGTTTDDETDKNKTEKDENVTKDDDENTTDNKTKKEDEDLELVDELELMQSIYDMMEFSRKSTKWKRKNITSSPHLISDTLRLSNVINRPRKQTYHLLNVALLS